MNEKQIRKYIDEMLDGSGLHVLRIVYRVLLGLV